MKSYNIKIHQVKRRMQITHHILKTRALMMTMMMEKDNIILMLWIQMNHIMVILNRANITIIKLLQTFGVQSINVMWLLCVGRHNTSGKLIQSLE